MNPAESSFIYVTKGKPTCLSGFLKRSDEKIFLSFRISQKSIASSLSIIGKIDNN
jgi:hypothetical protein